MKKNFYYAMISAALLTGAAGFSACSSDDVVTEVNPNLSADGKEVKTQFALNIPRAKSGRMTGTTTQQEGSSFRGMEGIKLIPLTTAGYTGNGDAHVMISLANIGTNDEDFADRVKVYSDVSIPVGTKGFLFYGHAAEGKHVDPTMKDGLHKFDLGKLVPQNLEVNKVPNSYEFALDKVKDGDVTSTELARAILTALNNIVAVEGWNTDKELGELYTKFTSLKAGSANSVLAAVQSLYDNVANYGDETIGGKIKKVIKDNFSVNDNKVAWTNNNSFPTNFNLPEGSVALTFSDTKNEFSYGTKNVIGGTSNVSVSSITFPASLYYMANTGVKANSSPTESWPSLDQWANGFLSWDSEVKATTRKIALANTVNYAVAQLVTTFTCEKETLPAKTITINGNTTIEQYVPVNTKEGGFPVTGLLIGGQPTKVNYDFLPESTDGFTYTVYDNAIADGVKANVKSDGNTPTANYTLLLSNWKGASEKNQNNVNFAVELKNNSGQAFQGADGLVPVDGTFYLIGTLKPEKNKNENIEGVENPSVFMRDYKTTARINITTLATAYNTIPDLRATNLELGLAVDLTWKTGMDFDVNIGEE